MRSFKVTKRYLLRKKWIDGDTCKFIFVAAIALIIFTAISSLSIPPSKYTENPHEVLGEQTAKNQPTAYNLLNDKRDLNAQEGMWRATNLVSILTIFQVFIGIFGIMLLYQTLRATQKTIDFGRETLRITQETLRQTEETTAQAERSTKAANRSADAAEKAEKAYVYPLVKAQFTNVSSVGQDGRRPAAYKREFEVKISVRNFGRTPTRGGEILTGLFDPDHSIDGDGWMPNKQRIDRFDAIGSNDESDVIRTITLTSTDYFIPFHDRKPNILAKVDFTDSVGKKWSDSCVMYIRFLDQTGAAISNDDMSSLSSSEIKEKADSVKIWVSRNKQPND